MDISWGSKTINVYQADMVLIQTVPSVIYRLDLDIFRLELKNIEDSSDGMAFPRTHKHNTTVSVGGATLARVIEIVNGYTVSFEETGTPYRVNTVGANSNIGERINLGAGQVSVSTSNSAGLQDLNSLQAASFDGEVTIRPSSTFSGTAFPIGTRATPVDNLADALLIANTRGISNIRIMENMTLSAGDFSDGYTFLGDNPASVTITLDSAVNISYCTFKNMTIQGELDNANILRECNVLNITNINGFVHECALSGTIILGGGSQSTIMSCYSGVAGGTLTPIIDMGGSGNPLALRNYSGGLKLTNSTGTGDHSLDFTSGQLIVDSTVTDSTIYVRGSCKVTDNSTGSAVVNDETETSIGISTLGISSTILGNVL